MNRKLFAIGLLAAGGFVWLLAQTKPGAAVPGGTPEENLWQTLVLMGVGDAVPASWNCPNHWWRIVRPRRIPVRGSHWYYVRVEQSNGELAWSSPIWVRYQ